MAIDVRTRTQEIVSRLEQPDFLEQIRESLPESVTLDRFKRVTITAIRANPDLAGADQTSLFASIVRCAQDGLFPDGREAALVLYKGKVGYIPMIAGIRKIAAEYGWSIRTNVVYENDEFDYTDEPPVIHHRPVRPGAERGDMIAAYAVATHRDGRRFQSVLHPADVAKRRAKAQTQHVWNEWPEAMWEKSAGHDIFGQLPLDSADLRVSRVLHEGVLVDPVAALYGPRGEAEGSSAAPPAGAATSGASAAGDGGGAADGDAAAAAAEPSPAAADEEEDAVWEALPSDEEVAEAAALVVPRGVHKDKTLAEVAELEQGPAWLLRQLKAVPTDAPDREKIETFVHARLPEVWGQYQAWRQEQAA